MRQTNVWDRRRSSGGTLQRVVALVAMITLALGMAPGMGSTQTQAATTVQQTDPPCTTICYVNAATGNDTFGGASPDFAKRTIQAALTQVDVGGTVSVAPGTYAEAVSITKNGVTLQGAGAGTDPAQHTIIDGPVATNSGIRLPAPNTTGVTISGLRVQEFTGGGICSIGANNNNFTVNGVHAFGNTTGNGCQGGVYINGPVTDVTINNVRVENNTSRGIVIWNGFKQRITITNNTVINNNCCGIELQDGTASGVTITGNTVTGNADSGIAAIGLMGGAGPNLIANNTLTDNGRFGIEVKLPNGTGAEEGDGSIVVRDNTVQRSTPIEVQRPSEERDLGGIVVIRRGWVAGSNNVDIPAGVVVKNNTVSGYRQTNPASVSEGFGIVVEGRRMSVYGNTVSNNDVGIQRQSGHLPYTPNTNSDGLQDDLADQYFGRGNSPVVCAMIGANTLSNNGADTRDVNLNCDTVGQLVFSTQPGGAAAGAPLSPQPVVSVLDGNGNPFTTYTGTVTMTLGVNPSTGVLSGTTAISVVNGLASFTDLAISRAGVGYTLVATTDGGAAATSEPFTIAAGPATQLVFSTQPGGAPALSPLNPQPVVSALDANGDVATSYTGTVTLALGNNPGSGVLSGTVTISAVNGVASFSGLSVSAPGVGYTLVATGEGLTPATSEPFTVTAELVATQLVFSTQPGGAAAGAPLNPQPVVSVLDQNGALVTSYNGPVTLSLGNNPGGATLNGFTTVNAFNGVATFSNVAISEAGTGYTLVATASGLTSATSGPITITAVAPPQYFLYLPLARR
jgi:parallel beta-helix repeat protein